ncbi:NIPSNAP family protein [Paenibacillus sp. OV219]|uniref:NIPSNAP family protein n=1 Tax=Paenibacillus sp. OV219 TaxID=1884377 RepID=UPI0008D05EAA|nr:NIPSNAP family protein [Paenibacillus sp. OV219]SEO00782.1 NIPSNAP protein [Paenibacillus sp. OV219]
MLYELRIYHVVPGRMNELLDRFRDHTLKLFEKHQLKVTNFWLHIDESKNQFYYVFEHKDLAARQKNFQAFLDDPEWLELQERTERNGPLYEKIDEIYMSNAPFFQSA